VRAGGLGLAAALAALAVAAPSASPGQSAPVVWVQAGHVGPREPGYQAQTGAGSGPFGSEIGFTTRVTRGVVARLRRAGVAARATPGRVTPIAAAGAVFVSIHHDAPGGRGAVGHAIAGAGENWYHGEGSGTPSPVPYADSAPHRPATTVSPAVERASHRLARRLAARFGPVAARNGSGSSFAGVISSRSNPRMNRYYGFYRTRARARVILEAGAAGADDAFLRRTDLIAATVAGAVLDHLRAEGLLGRGG